MLRMGMEEDQNIDSSLVSKAIGSAQKKVENRNFEIRKHLLEYDNVMNDQRSYIYGRRMEFLKNENIEEEIKNTIAELIESKLEEMELPRSGIPVSLSGEISDWLLELTRSDMEIDLGLKDEISLDELRDKLIAFAEESLRKKTLEFGEEIASHIERFMTLQSIDKRWKEHLYEMDGLREGIGYQAYAQKDPLIEYKFQSFNIFQELIRNINTDIIRNLFRVRVAPTIKRPSIWQINKVQHDAYGQFRARDSYPEPGQEVSETGPSVATAVAAPPKAQRTQIVVGKKVGRNEPCPCGSGKKYKYCCGR